MTGDFPAIEPALTLEIDLGALVENWRDLARRSRPARTSAVVKANAYGLGIEPVVGALYRAGCRDFFTATVAEGVAVRPLTPEARIFVLNGVYPGVEAATRAADLVPVLSSSEQVALWAADCAENGEHPAALQVDTGMNRLGVTCAEALALASDTTRPAGFSPVLVMSHLACADQPEHPMNTAQCEAFRRVAQAFSGVESSLSNSAAILLGGDFLCDLTRPGIALYGGACRNDVLNPMRPVVTARARILQIREASTGETVSYGAAERLARDTRIAVCAVGYADGYLRSHSGAGVPLRNTNAPKPHGFIAGRRVPVLGRITMDMTMFDITDVPSGAVSTGDSVELFGPNMPLDEVALAAGTIGYEVLTAMGGRYWRFYTKHG